MNMLTIGYFILALFVAELNSLERQPIEMIDNVQRLSSRNITKKSDSSRMLSSIDSLPILSVDRAGSSGTGQVGGMEHKFYDVTTSYSVNVTKNEDLSLFISITSGIIHSKRIVRSE